MNMERDDLSFMNAAAAGRLVVTLLFLANAVAYVVTHGAFAIGGMTLAIGAATLGYLSCSNACFEGETGNDGQKLLLASTGLCVLSGAAFLLGA